MILFVRTLTHRFGGLVPVAKYPLTEFETDRSQERSDTMHNATTSRLAARLNASAQEKGSVPDVTGSVSAAGRARPNGLTSRRGLLRSTLGLAAATASMATLMETGVRPVEAAPSPSVFNVRDYGATGDGSTPDTAAIQAAINAAKAASGGTVFFPQGLYLCTGQLNLDGTYAIQLDGPVSPTAGAWPATVITYAGTDPSFISARGSVGFTMRGLFITYSNPNFQGVLVDISGIGKNDHESSQALIENCVLYGEPTQQPPAIACAALISLSNAETSTIRNNNFNAAQVAIRGAATANDDAVNAQILNNQFMGELQQVGIKNPGTSWLMQGNSFEAVQQQATGFGIAAACASEPGVTSRCTSFIGNWCGDAYNQGTWIDWSGENLLVLGNLFGVDTDPALGGTGSSTAIAVRGASTGVSIISNQMDSPSVAIDLGSGAGAVTGNAVIIGNQYGAGVGLPIAGRLPAGALYQTGCGTVGIGPGATPGAPATGSPQIGEVYVDSDGNLFISTAAGWKQVAVE